MIEMDFVVNFDFRSVLIFFLAENLKLTSIFQQMFQNINSIILFVLVMDLKGFWCINTHLLKMATTAYAYMICHSNDYKVLNVHSISRFGCGWRESERTPTPDIRVLKDELLNVIRKMSKKEWHWFWFFDLVYPFIWGSLFGLSRISLRLK